MYSRIKDVKRKKNKLQRKKFKKPLNEKRK